MVDRAHKNHREKQNQTLKDTKILLLSMNLNVKSILIPLNVSLELRLNLICNPVRSKVQKNQLKKVCHFTLH